MEFDEKEDQEAEMEMETNPPTNHDHSLSNVEIGGRRKSNVRYRECLKNHAVNIGGHAVDGCCEFMPAGEEGTLDALKCAACNCHRNFHRKESDTGGSNSNVVGGGGQGHGQGQPESSSRNQLHHHHQFSSYYRAAPPPAGYLHLTCTPPPTNPHHMRPLALPPSTAMATSGGGYARDDEDVSNPSSSGGGGGGGSGSISKKRFRTKFTHEQKEKMLGLAERIGWRIQKQDETIVDEFCEESGVRKQVLKVWMHNNKHILSKKP